MGLPALSDLVTKTPLYEKFKLDDELIEEVYQIRCFTGSIDSYCPDCGKESIFLHVINEEIKKRFNEGGQIWKLTGNVYATELKNYSFKEEFFCTRNVNHNIIVYFLADKDVLIKIGQYPSIADLESGEILRYRKVLDQSLYKEFSKAIGLKSHGIGIGSFVYLRRIFERLLEDAHCRMKVHNGWDEDLYNRSRVDEKILMLEPELPNFLVENRTLYGILSKGIHELSEEECLEYFEVVKTSIEIILNEVLRKKEHEEKVTLAKKAIDKITQTLKHTQSIIL